MRDRRSTSSSRKLPSTAVGSIPRARSLFSTSARFSRTKFKSSISNYFTGTSNESPGAPSFALFTTGGILEAPDSTRLEKTSWETAADPTLRKKREGWGTQRSFELPALIHKLFSISSSCRHRQGLFLGFAHGA